MELIELEKIAERENINLINFKMHRNKDSRVKGSLVDKIITEIEQMKTGSIALINQITTISKQRIYNPKKDFDILSGIQISDENMKLIDEKLKSFFIN